MASIRQEKIARVIRESVSDTISHRLSDPRITGLVSITKVDVAADLRVANIYLSIFGTDEKKQRATFNVIVHAKKKIQALLGEELQSRFCPVLQFHMDENFKKTLETIRLIEQLANESHEDKPQQEQDDNAAQ